MNRAIEKCGKLLFKRKPQNKSSVIFFLAKPFINPKMSPKINSIFTVKTTSQMRTKIDPENEDTCKIQDDPINEDNPKEKDELNNVPL